MGHRTGQDVCKVCVGGEDVAPQSPIKRTHNYSSEIKTRYLLCKHSRVKGSSVATLAKQFAPPSPTYIQILGRLLRWDVGGDTVRDSGHSAKRILRGMWATSSAPVFWSSQRMRAVFLAGPPVIVVSHWPADRQGHQGQEVGMGQGCEPGSSGQSISGAACASRP